MKQPILPSPPLLKHNTILHNTSQRRRPLQPNTIAYKKLIEKMLMPNTRRSMFRKLINSLLDAEMFLVDKIAADEEAGAVETVVAVYADERFCFRRCFRRLCTQPIDQLDEIFRLFRRRRDLGDGREFMVLNTALIEALGIIDGTLVADIDDGLDLALPVADEDVRGVRIVDFAQGLHGAEDARDGVGDGAHGLPFGEVLDVPFAFCGEVLQLPAEGESGVDVFVEEGVDEAG